MTSIILFVGLALYFILYFTYGKKLEKNIVKANNDNKTPAERLSDGVDYVPAHKAVLFGHHFASIAGAAPIVGPVLAMAWGWLPALLWVWFGNIFIGAVHDYLALMASVRYDGKSIQFVASDIITKRTGNLFYYLVFFLLILVVGAFANVVGGMFTSANGPQIASSYIFTTIAAVIMGLLMYRLNVNIVISTIIGIILLGFAIIGGLYLPVKASYNVWMIVLFLYIILASAIPVNILLQPRDYLNSWLLYLGLIIGGIAAIFSVKGFTAPAVTNFAPIISDGKPTPFWPAITLIIACGSLSGFHSLVASGTSSKQLSKEKDGLFVGYGAMLTEGFLSTIVIIAVAGFGFGLLTNAGMELTVQNWGTQYTKAMMGKFPSATMFVVSYAAMVNSTWLKIIPTAIVTSIAGMWVASFALTTLDTTNRLGRYCLCEIASPLKDKNTSIYNFISNRWVASLIPAAIGIALAWSKKFSVLWPSFGSANQLIASIALLTGTTWVAKKLKSKASLLVMIPAILLWITVTAGIIWFSVIILPVTISKAPSIGITVLVIEIIMLLMNFVFIFDFIKNYKKVD